MTLVTEIVEPRTSALLCWPVQMMPSSESNAHNYHLTALYLPEVTHSKEQILESIDKFNGYLFGAFDYRLADVTGTGAFGPESNIPVLRIGPTPGFSPGNQILANHEGLVFCLHEVRIPFSIEFAFNPHVTVSLITALNPPKQVLLRPLELWYKDDEPVVV